jgi:ribosomal-protein-alanine N-acetyltransferase
VIVIIKVEMTQSPDLKRLADIHNACFARGWDTAAIGEMLGIKATAAFMAHDGSGFGLLRHLGEEAEILTLAVMPAHRRSGVGVAIVSAMREWAEVQGAKAIFLEVGESNASARKLYEKSGFSFISRRKQYYRGEDGSREDALVMRWTAG